MNKTLAFAKLDFLTVKSYMTIKNLLIFLVLFGLIGYGTGQPSTLIGMFMMYGVIYASYPFMVGDKNGIDTLYSTLPITKKNIVFGRYIFALSLNVCIAVLSFIVSVILMATLGKGIMLTETLITILICFILFSTIEAIQLPIYFKYGYDKAKFLAYLPLAAFPAAAIAVSSLWGEGFFPFIQNVFLWIETNIVISGILTAVIWVLIMCVSAMLSYRFYRKREF